LSVLLQLLQLHVSELLNLQLRFAVSVGVCLWLLFLFGVSACLLERELLVPDADLRKHCHHDANLRVTDNVRYARLYSDVSGANGQSNSGTDSDACGDAFGS